MNCVWCNRGGLDPNVTPVVQCPQCEHTDWNQEPNYHLWLGAWNDYEILGESVGGDLIMWLELKLVGGTATARPPLTHRLKEVYRHARSDLGVKDGRGLIIQFRPVRGDSNPWEIHLKRPPYLPRS